MKQQLWWNIFLQTGSPEAYVAYRMQRSDTEEPDVSENQRPGAAGNRISGC